MGRNLAHTLWLRKKHGVDCPYVSPLILNTLEVWGQKNSALKLAPPTSPLIPLGGFSWVITGEYSFFFFFTRGGGRVIAFISLSGSLRSLKSLRSEWGLSILDYWKCALLQGLVQELYSSFRCYTDLALLQTQPFDTHFNGCAQYFTGRDFCGCSCMLYTLGKRPEYEIITGGLL